MPDYVEIAVNVPQVRGVFHYHLPAGLSGQIRPGHLVTAPFGKQQVQGVVLRRVAQPSVAETKPVASLLDPEPVLTAAQLALAEHLAEAQQAPLAAFIELMLPPGLSQQSETVYSLHAEHYPRALQDGLELTATQRRLLTLLEQRGPLRTRQLEKAMPRRAWEAAARTLARRGLLVTHTALPEPQLRPKTVRTARLACPPETAQAALAELGRAGSAALARRQAMLRFLIQEGGEVAAPWLYAESQGTAEDLRYLAQRGLVQLGESQVWRDPLEAIDPQPAEAPPLTAGQQAAWQALRGWLGEAAAGQAGPPVLLHGVTGSGKTEIYLQAVAETLRLGRQAIILVPEIAITPQTVRRFLGRFPGQVGLVHSRLSPGERYDTWRRARAGAFSVVVGPRSALFTPFPNVGLVVVDEFHDDSYYQADLPPVYNARQAALALARIASAVCVLGSATPDTASYYQAEQGSWRLLHLPQRILAHRQAVEAQAARLGIVSHYQPLEGQAESIPLPAVQVVDMRAELRQGNRSIFSQALQQALAAVLESQQQAILFLNRRGTATYVFCRDCGHVLKCPNCDSPLTFHSPQEALSCHTCGYQRRLPRTCPACGGTRIRQYGMGTEKVESEIQALYPQARLLRWDQDTTRHKGAHEAILTQFARRQADILIGTQMLAKGLDLPLVTLVGVVLADVGLNLPDYRAAERVFQVLTQVAGRAGRSPLGGRVILQTFQPEQAAIQAAARHDYAGFYAAELAQRRRLGYPPFTRLARLELRSPDAAAAESEARRMAQAVRAWLEAEGRRATGLIGPAPCFFSRLGGEYRWQIVLRGPDPAALLRGRDLRSWRLEIDPPSLL
jgi:primosomal protein N' (replication factor Y)